MSPAPSNLLRLERYLQRYRDDKHPAALEHLVASAFGVAFCSPLQCQRNRDDSIANRVLWFGTIDPSTRDLEKAPAGPDAVCFAYGFQVLIEATLRSGRNQWRREFNEAVRHYDNHAQTYSLGLEDLYLVLVAPSLHEDTYRGFRQKALDGWRVLLLDTSCLGRIAKISRILPTVRHLDLRHLMNEIVRKLSSSPSLRSYSRDRDNWVTDWGREMLQAEKTVFFGLRSYEAMKEVGRDIVGASEILLHLKRDRTFEDYLAVVGGDLSAHVKQGLICERLARLVPSSAREDFFCRVDPSDYRERASRLMRAVERSA